MVCSRLILGREIVCSPRYLVMTIVSCLAGMISLFQYFWRGWVLYRDDHVRPIGGSKWGVRWEPAQIFMMIELMNVPVRHLSVGVYSRRRRSHPGACIWYVFIRTGEFHQSLTLT